MSNKNNVWDIIEKCSGKCGPPTTFAELKIENYCEIGVREGNTFKSRTSSVSGTAVAIDCWDLYEKDSQNDMGRVRSEAENQYILLNDLYKSDENVEIIKAFSNDETVVDKFEDEFFNVIFIDGDHSYEGCLEDLEKWWPKVKSGWILCGHDYCKNQFGVKKAVDEFRSRDEISKDIVNWRVHDNDEGRENPNPTFFIQKR